MVLGATIVRPAEGPVVDHEFTTCPIAEVRRPDGWVVDAMRAAARHQAGVPLRDMLREPTDAMVEAVRVIDEERHHLQAFERRLAERERG